MLGLFYGLNQFMVILCSDFDVALVLFSRRFWLFDVAKGGENLRGRIYHKLRHKFQSYGGIRDEGTHYQLYIVYLDFKLLSS